ncbi:hypothetical protein OIDMADRAFT_195881 [Oidiodendron maius Zn]|uniref:HTH CENPB-type domain-containing protein n=1 Tax=Oidiodendron maius (strain Zn) TaxID=913774 RepID=A0A0C3CWD3_OIDMZ|nr:hypothetical protein OIDMADRAFT_195881 [Oidiodendron maius Zn]
MAEEILMRRVQLASTQTTLRSNPTPMGHEWIYRFLQRHPQFKGTYSRQLESVRHKEATPEKISAWFDAFKARRGTKIERNGVEHVAFHLLLWWLNCRNTSTLFIPYMDRDFRCRRFGK